ncbi:MAG: hypothetical protein D6761_06960 [Candidatus Dadabacteria bacterium]|nr:MAG: hypothetical protein D6761_06960 [Candidatus Dadabacteria bacterium]
MAKDLVKLRKKATEAAVKGKLDKALELYQEIVKADPKDIKTWVKIGDIYKKLGRNDQAIEIYAKAATSYAVSGFLMQAISVNKMILEIDPNHAETQAALAALYAQKEGADSAESGPTVGAGVKGASSSVLEMLKKKPSAAAAPPSEPAPAPEAPAEPEAEPESEAEAAAASGKLPQFDAVDLDLADDLFDQIMKQDVVEIKTEDDVEHVLGTLPNIPLFSSLNQDEFTGIVEKLNLRRFDVGDRIIKEGDEGTSFYIIAGGAAKITKTAPNGKEITVATLGEGDFFGEFSFFAGSIRSANVTVTQEMEALEIDRDDLEELTKQFPRIEEVMRAFYKERLVGTMLRISPIFQPLNDEDRAAIMQHFETVETRTGDVLIRQGEEGQGLYVIAGGEIAVSVKGDDGNMLEVARLREGEFFGEISLITDRPTTANCIAVKPSLLFRLPRAAFKQIIAEYPQVLEVTADYADQRVKQTKAMIAGGDELQKAGIV